MLEALQGVSEEPPTEEEVERTKAAYAAGFDLLFNDPQSIAVKLSEWAAMGDWRLLFLHRDRVAQVTPEDVLEVARKYLIPSNRTLGYYHPTAATPPRAEIPDAPDVSALVADYKGRAAVTEGEAFEPTPENIERRTRKLKLSSGIKVALLPKKTHGAGVSLSYRFRHGTEATVAGKSTAASFAGSMLTRGTAKRSRQEIQDALFPFEAHRNLSGDATSVGGTVGTMRENLPGVLRLLGEMLRQPAFDPAEFELLRQESVALVEAKLSDPMALVKNAFDRHTRSQYGAGHVFYMPTLQERLERINAVTVDEAKNFWASFYGAEGGTIAIVGDFDPDEIVAVLEEVFADWKADEAYQHVPRVYQDVDAMFVDIETPGKSNAFMVATQAIQMRSDHPDYPALLLANYMLGGGFLNSRLVTRIRQQDGLSYGIGSEFAASDLDDVGRVVTYAAFAPENADKVVAAFREEMARVLESGFTEEEVVAAKRGYLDSARNTRADDFAVARHLNRNLFLDRTMDFTARQEAAIAALTPEDILAALQRHIDMDRMSIFRAGDFANKLAVDEQAVD